MQRMHSQKAPYSDNLVCLLFNHSDKETMYYFFWFSNLFSPFSRKLHWRLGKRSKNNKYLSSLSTMWYNYNYQLTSTVFPIIRLVYLFNIRPCTLIIIFFIIFLDFIVLGVRFKERKKVVITIFLIFWTHIRFFFDGSKYIPR